MVLSVFNKIGLLESSLYQKWIQNAGSRTIRKRECPTSFSVVTLILLFGERCGFGSGNYFLTRLFLRRCRNVGEVKLVSFYCY